MAMLGYLYVIHYTVEELILSFFFSWNKYYFFIRYVTVLLFCVIIVIFNLLRVLHTCVAMSTH